ncbi:MAG TPA: hypothetical protein VMH33_04865 [Solirubrobacterales bacterium]|nr:hypothetical protein [Solirubrobacterales bacterium]
MAQAPPRVRKEPLYLTLAGAEGRDVKALIDAGLIKVSEIGAILDEDADKIVAIEADEEAFLQLKRTIEGLDARKDRIENLLRNESPFNWPQGEEREIFRARVVNFDFDRALVVEVREGQLAFPQLSWVAKVAEIHGHAPALDWCLMLTFQGQVQWPSAVEDAVKKLLADNFERTQDFSASVEKLLGPDAVSGISGGDTDLKFSELDEQIQQCVLMTLVPKKIIEMVRGSGWCVKTHHNVRYGGTEARAPMVSFVFDFVWSARGTTEPGTVYRESLLDSVAGPVEIDPEGAIVPLFE